VPKNGAIREELRPSQVSGKRKNNGTQGTAVQGTGEGGLFKLGPGIRKGSGARTRSSRKREVEVVRHIVTTTHVVHEREKKLFRLPIRTEVSGKGGTSPIMGEEKGPGILG